MVDFITYPNRRTGLLCWREKVHIFRGQSTGKFQIKYIIWSTDYGRMMAISQNIFWLGLRSKVFCGKNNWIMEIMDKGMKVPKWFGQKYPKIYSTDFSNWPKTLGYRWKRASFDVRSPWYGALKIAENVRRRDTEKTWQVRDVTSFFGLFWRDADIAWHLDLNWIIALTLDHSLQGPY